MSTFKKILRFFSSMRFAIVLLVLLALACIVGSVFPQLQSYDYYAARYSERAATVVLVLYLDDVFHSWWFIALTALLCLNLLSCNLLRAKGIFQRVQADCDIQKTLRSPADIEIENGKDPEKIFQRLRIHAVRKTELPDGTEAWMGTKNRIGHWGAWICHLGMLLLIFGFALGQMTAQQFTVAGFAGDKVLQADAGNGGMKITIEDFAVTYDQDGSPKQYTTKLSAQSDAQEETGTASVNHPARLFGYLFSQNSYGYAAEAQIMHNGTIIETKKLLPQEAFALSARPDVTVYLDSISPSANGYSGFLYSSYIMGGYMGSREGIPIMEGEEQTLIGDYSISFAPTAYTVLVARRDVFRVPTLIGALMVLLGLMLSFYFRPVKLLAVRNAEGSWTLKGYARKGDAIFADKLKRATGKGETQNV